MSAKKDSHQPEIDTHQLEYHIITDAHQYLVVRHSHVWRPPTDVIEEADRLVVLVEVAGMQHGEFHITLSQRRLTISGSRAAAHRASAAYHQVEVRHGEFRTDIALPWPVEENAIAARYADGFLHVELPRMRREKVHIVPVIRAE